MHLRVIPLHFHVHVHVVHAEPGMCDQWCHMALYACR